MPRLLRLVISATRLVAFGAVLVALVALLAIGLGPWIGAYQVRTVLTGSMRPTMPEGSVVVTTPVRSSRLREHDVITYRIPVEDRRIVTHRIVEVVEPGNEPVVRTKGDANTAPDHWVARLRGGQAWRARTAVPKVGYVLFILRRPEARRLTVVGAPALFGLVSVVRIWAPEREEDAPDGDDASDEPRRRQRDEPPPRQEAEKPRREPAPRPLTQEERWAEWRIRRVHQPPIGWDPDG
jgi:signal peptidase